MKAVQPYLFFNGNCREAMQFYADALGAPVHMMPYSQQPNCAEADRDRIMHATINAPDGSALMASDTPAGKSIPEGKNFHISIACDTAEEEDRIFAFLSAGGNIFQPLQQTFWGARFGMLTDKFGIGWMLSYHSGPQA